MTTFISIGSTAPRKAWVIERHIRTNEPWWLIWEPGNKMNDGRPYYWTENRENATRYTSEQEAEEVLSLVHGYIGQYSDAYTVCEVTK